MPAPSQSKLSEARLVAFFRAALTEERPVAVKIMVRELDAGKTVADVARIFAPDPERAGGLRMSLKVQRISPRVFIIRYGLAGGHSGDGGTWRVTFSAGSTVLRLVQQEWWIC